MPIFDSIDTLSKPLTISKDTDTSQPYSFQDWRVRNINIQPRDAFGQYDAYVKGWYSNKKAQNQVTIDYVKAYYVAFLKELGIAYKNSDEQVFFENVNFDDDLSIQAVIAGYARKLKDIAVYLSQKRNQVVYTKLKFNLTGTNTAIVRLFYNYLLNAFTRKTSLTSQITTSLIVTDSSILNSLPFLSNISQNFSIEIEEVYDTENYFDRDPSLDVSTYTTLASTTPEALYDAGSYTIPNEYLISSVVAALATAAATTLVNVGSVTNIITTNPTYSNLFIFIGDGSTNTFTLSNITDSNPADYQVSIDGILQTPTVAYTINLQSSSIVFTGAPNLNSEVTIVVR